MRNLIVLLILLPFVNSVVNAQEEEKTVSDTLTQKEFRDLLKKEFYFLANSEASTSISNFASLETKDGKVTLQTNFFLNGGIFENRDIILGIRASGAGSSESLPIYSENEFNSNIGIEVELKFPNYALSREGSINSNAKVEYLDSEKEAQGMRLRKLDEAFEIDTYKIRNKKEVFEFEKLVKEKEFKIIQIEGDIKKVHKPINKDFPRLRDALNDRNENGELIDSLQHSIANHLRNIHIKRLEQEKLNQEIDEIEIKKKYLNSEGDLFWVRRKKWEQERKKEKANLTLVGHDVSWWSFGYGFNNTKFKLFNPSISFEEQKLDTSYLSHRFEISYSRSSIEFLSRKNFFLTIGGSFEITDNRESSLSSMTLRERTNYGTEPDDRYSIKESTVLVGDYKTGLSSISFFGDYYRFLFLNSQSALHGRLEFLKEDDQDFQTNLGIGFVTTLLNKDREKSVINAELFWGIEDFYGINTEEGNVFDRSSIALRFSVPFNYNKPNN